MRYMELFLCLGFMIVAFYLGYMWALKRHPVITTEAETRAATKTALVSGNAKISDIRVDTEARMLNRAAKKTDEKKDKLETLREDLKENQNYPTEFTTEEREAMAEVIQAQDAELKAARALNVELLIARDSWRNAYQAAREENDLQRIAHEARLAAIRGEKFKIGAISLGVGFIGGMLAK